MTTIRAGNKSLDVNFCKEHRDKIEVPDPLAVEDLVSSKLNNHNIIYTKDKLKKVNLISNDVYHLCEREKHTITPFVFHLGKTSNHLH